MITRRKSIGFNIGNVAIGAGAPISVQSMCNTDTRDVKATLRQIDELAEAGCELIRLAVLDMDAAVAIKDIVDKSPIPVIADIHFDYKLAIQAINSGVSALRLNPGNIGKRENVEKVVNLAKQQQIPIRIGVNAGSLERHLVENNEISLAEKLVESALGHVKILEDLDFNLIKISLKSSDVLTTIEAYKLIADKVPYPLHLGVTEAGTLKAGLVKSSVGLGTLLAQGIGDTIRVSLTEQPIEEIYAGYSILKSLGLRQKGVNFISCPTCGRTQIDLISLAKQVEERFKNLDKNITIAVMGCAVNGPGEARGADFGIAGGVGEGLVFQKGVIVAKVPENELLDKLEDVIKKSSV